MLIIDIFTIKSSIQMNSQYPTISENMIIRALFWAMFPPMALFTDFYAYGGSAARVLVGHPVAGGARDQDLHASAAPLPRRFQISMTGVSPASSVR